MKISLKPLAVLVAALSLTFCAASARADNDHPAYLHALQDLRYARALLYRLTPNGGVDDLESHAIGEIDAAIREIKQASIDDGKDLDDHPPIDTRLRRTDRYRQAIQLLHKAHSDVKRDEDNGFARGLQGRALFHIDEADRTVDRILRRLDSE